jgi:hypothetical protein
VFYLAFGLITTFYPRLMQLFMTEQGIDASTAFSDQVWLHGGLDILSICVLLFALATLPPMKRTLQAAALVAVFPVVAIVYTFLATPFWNPLFLLPAAFSLAFSVYGLVLSHRGSDSSTAAATAVH